MLSVVFTLAGCEAPESKPITTMQHHTGPQPAAPEMASAEPAAAVTPVETKPAADSTPTAVVEAVSIPSPGAKERSAAALKVHPDDFLAHVAVLADDNLGGRGIGSRGIDQAAAYIAGQYALIGAQPGGDNGTYFQEFDVALGGKLTDEHNFAVDGISMPIARGTDYIPFGFSGGDSFDGEVAFVGYGIVNPEENHDDYAGIDVTDKVVLMLRREPPSWGGPGQTTRKATFRNKVYTAKEKGAAAVLIVNRHDDNVEDRLMRFRAQRSDFGIPSFHITQEMASALLAAGGSDAQASLQAAADEGQNVSRVLAGIRMSGDSGVQKSYTRERNVIGIIPGDGPLSHEFVVIGGHYDHLGKAPTSMMLRSDRSDNTPRIHNGADDNASGTAGIIESGRILAARRPLKRSVMLIAFTAEEVGLLGSKHYVENPTVPLEDTVAMINMDMIGRFDEDGQTLQVFGTKAAEEFETMIARHVSDAGMVLRGSESASGPSDHSPFYEKKIPSVHVFTGLHGDYHRPNDDVDKVNAEGGARVTDVVAAIAYDISERDDRVTYNEVKARAQVSGRRSGVVMGIMPGYADNNVGMAIDGVSSGGPAEKAGMQTGDVITRIGDAKIANIQDYMAALRNNKPGDVVKVTVRRGDSDVIIDVKLGGR